MATTSSVSNENVATMLWETAGRLSNKTAVVERRGSVTYGELLGRSSAVARALESSAVEPGDRVVVQLERGIEAVAAYFGVLAAGGLPVFLNADYRPRQIEYALDHSGARLFLTSEDVQRRMHRRPESETGSLLVDDLPEAAECEPVRRTADDPAQITYTSGSTGMPKGVLATHGNVWAAIETVAGYLELEEDDRIAGLLPVSGVYGANQMQCAVLAGATLIVPKLPLMNDVADQLRAGEATVLAAVPPLWKQLLDAPAFTSEPIPSLRLLQNAGGHLSPAAVERLREVQPQAGLFLQYGMTEVFRSTFLAPDEVEDRPGSMGRPMPGTEILVVREDDTLCEPGEVGELVHAGPTVTEGYWNDPEKTAEVYRPHPVHGEETVVYSGDMVRRDEEGYLYFVSRKDRMINSLGHRVGPDEVLDVLYASERIRDGVVTSEPDETRGEAIVVYVVLTDEASVEGLVKFCRAELPRYMQPSRVVPVEEIPRLPNGKHDLAAVRERAGAT